MKHTLPTRYDHRSVEAQKYETWLKHDLFRAQNTNKPPFCIVIPPPNVTGKLHLGHAWDTALQDIIARFKRMQGYDMLWLAGMDHAGIATQAKVEARLKEEGISKYDLGRQGFLDKAWEWKHTYADFIREQWATLGLSLDYSRERFTLDEGLSEAVKKVFVDLYNEGLIYQGERIINWDPQAQTALSNIEVIHKEVEGGMYHFRFKVVGSDEVLVVATTRPETMFGDVCVFVHPDDPRYTHLHGKTVVNPASKREMPILCDSYIDMSFGSGAMKCTPAHDPNDFNLAQTHHLDKVLCMNPDGTMNELAQKYVGLDRFDCRQALVAQLQEEGLVEKIEKHIHQVGHSERTDVIVEPYLSKQWFVKMKPMAEAVLKKQKEQGMNFVPERFEKTFIQWLENIEDWCISRQLWWGHRIPAYFHKESGDILVSLTPPQDSENYTQDEDVLDTWFSSALWPFSTLGWPDTSSSDLQRFFPNSVLVTGYDIIFFWVARMAFMSEHFMHELPFKDVLIHGLVRDAQGRKMSKSLGNGVDPMEVIETYGADALRFFLTTSSSPGQDLRYMEEKVEASWNFINKLWNASRFVLMNCPDDFKAEEALLSEASELDGWLLTKLETTIKSVTEAMEAYDFGLAGSTLVNFTWNDFCSWSIELAKVPLNGSDEKVKAVTLNTLVFTLKAILKMLHPFMPFVSEEIYAHLSDEISISVSEYPTSFLTSHVDVSRVDRLTSLISALRELRLSQNIKKANDLSIQLQDDQGRPYTLSEMEADILVKMVNSKEGEINPEGALTLPILSASVIVSMHEHMDVSEQVAKLEGLKAQLEKEMARSKAMLSNESFLAKAQPSKVEAEKAKASEYERQYETILAQLTALLTR
ncbi:MAG: valine--tRNA ligase [Erysipelotrichaceae bacterium]|nr:valine--tRNA ligase [Erysipelotrichaceae bacterium]